MRTNILTHDRLLTLFDYDQTTGYFTRKIRTSTSTRVGEKAGSSNRYSQIKIDRVAYRVCRLAWFYAHGAWPSGQVDHRDRDPTNNRLVNLRDVSQSENQHNSGTRKDNWSGYPGVSWYAKNSQWRARIEVNKKSVWLGYFPTAALASAAYQAAKLIHHPTAPVAQQGA